MHPNCKKDFTKKLKVALFRLLVPATCIMAVSCSHKEKAEQFDVEGALNYCHFKVIKSLRDLATDSTDYTLIPRNIEGTDTAWTCRKATPDEWCSGFWPGVLWMDYAASGDEKVKQEAEKYTASLEYLSRQPIYDHDLGFLISCSYGKGEDVTANPEYKQIMLASADTLATLFNPTVGTMLSWPRNVEMFGGHNTIMDNMINLELLFWAARNGSHKELYDIAVKHAETTMKNHFRPDGTCYHVAVYDPNDGTFIKGMTHQGYSDYSTWARGQAWAIYGYTVVYRETKDPRFLDFACKVTDVYLDRLPEDRIPYWDFDDPNIPRAPRDASAAGVVASALLELQEYCDVNHKEKYRQEAENMLASLTGDNYRSDMSKDSFLDHSTGNLPAHSEIDASIIYADYYYLEALTRLKNLRENENSSSHSGIFTALISFLR